MTVSIIIPAYNAAATLRAAIESALSQPVAKEIVVVDDGSTDATGAVAQSFGEAVTLLSGPNQGVSAARNRGIAASSGAWIVFLDADDLLAHGTLERRLGCATTSSDVIIADWEEFIDDGRTGTDRGVRKSVDWAALTCDAQAAIASHVWATTAAILYPRGIVERIGGFRTDLPIIQDARFLFDAALRGARFVHADHLGAHYRVVDGSLSRRNPERFWLDVLLNGQQIEEHWNASCTLSPEREAVLARIYDVAARGLLRAGHDGFRSAVKAGARCTSRTLFLRLAGAMVPVLGVSGTKTLMKALRRI